MTSTDANAVFLLVNLCAGPWQVYHFVGAGIGIVLGTGSIAAIVHVVAGTGVLSDAMLLSKACCCASGLRSVLGAPFSVAPVLSRGLVLRSLGTVCIGSSFLREGRDREHIRGAPGNLT